MDAHYVNMGVKTSGQVRVRVTAIIVSVARADVMVTVMDMAIVTVMVRQAIRRTHRPRYLPMQQLTNGGLAWGEDY